ncbi:monovalent cation/H+ antiporter complex subunit F [Helcobacillus sp. ACRRO]|uniref:monovalent cation/H+ antiporter complex subunit F n=1 Tax=Helcobacillus sp. ACRRO TaxID=2918202 RepID=UPI001EF6069D|nr:monovalent cation/H+ antiporter complex subunit F [Helcobacillus sp. ACRRO]MCG7427261.1 monovalent cation/H+ antiporter complex subunit F [Helcobacillus sp. ACRRO]
MPDWVILVAGIILSLSTIPVIYRMVAGPTILDRSVGADMLMVFVLLALALFTAATHSTFAIVGMFAITALGFIGTMAFARFVSREETSQAKDKSDGVKQL